jgi:hypothetical protein
MRDEIRLGNEALAQNDMETAKQHFQHLLDHGGTPMQEQIAGNRLREIQAKQDALRPPPPPAKPPKRKPRHNYRYVCAELMRLYYRGYEFAL